MCSLLSYCLSLSIASSPDGSLSWLGLLKVEPNAPFQLCHLSLDVICSVKPG